MKPDRRRGPLIAAGLLLGLGLGGMAHGIVFHEILQTHQTMSAWLPPINLEDLRLNHFIDGVFLALMWCLLLLGTLLLHAAGRGERRWWSGAGLLGAGLLGWGLFELLDGLVCHYWLGLHPLLGQVGDPGLAEAALLAWALLLMVVGALLLRRGL
ncbi:MAG TPA: DUF2243 domain-containing protein, partial [Burkholderiaceae bacterium]|nr:DUF2243 domain-containing protein [Burkholderiaceae bacterium]